MNFKRLSIIVCTVTACAAEPEAHTAANARAQQAVGDRLDDAVKLVNDVGRKVPPEIADRAVCAVVLPAVVRGGLILGARHGHGFAVCQTDHGVSAPAPVSLSGGSAGPQIGLESSDILMVIMTDEGRQALMRGQFALGADISAAAGPVGTGSGASSDPTFHAPVLTYTRSSGLFAGAELSGVVLKPDQDATVALYGSDQDFRRLLAGEVKAPPRAHEFVATLETAISATSGH
jgi:lipid-binding SYLF domain-containing protein